jgi:hypothetical protein
MAMELKRNHVTCGCKTQSVATIGAGSMESVLGRRQFEQWFEGAVSFGFTFPERNYHLGLAATSCSITHLSISHTQCIVCSVWFS